MRALWLVNLVAASVVTVSACNPPAPSKKAEPTAQKKLAKQKKPPKPKKPKPTNPWLDSVLAKASVEVKVGDKVTQCAWNEGRKRHICDGLKGWMYVGGQALKVGGKDVYCAWNHPITGGTVTTKIPGVAKEALEFRHAFPGRAADQKKLMPVVAELKVDGKQVANLTRERSPGFAGTTLAAAKGNGDLEVIITAEKDGAAHYCWELKKSDGKTAVAPIPVPGAPPAAKATSITPDAKKMAVKRATKTAATKKALKVGATKAAEKAKIKAREAAKDQ